MSMAHLLRGPTGNSSWYLFPWNLLVFYVITLIGGFMSLGLLIVGQNWLLASLLINLFLVSIVAMMAREQLTYPFVACLPNYQPAVRRHLVLVGIAGNILLLVVGLVFYRVPLPDKLDTAMAMFCGGIALYFVLGRVILGIANLGYWNMVFTALLIGPTLLGMDPSPKTPFVIPLTLAARLALPLVALFSMWWFWQLLARPKHFRQVMDLPVSGGFDLSNSMEGFFSQYDAMEKFKERRRQHSRLSHWVSAVGIPGHSCVIDRLNVVVHRALGMLVRPAFWVTAFALCVIQSLNWSGSGPRFAPAAIIYPALLLVFTLSSRDVTSVSPLLPYSRLERALGVLAASLLSLLLFFGFMWVTLRVSALVGPLLRLDGETMAHIRSRDMILVILLWVPAYYMVQLLLSVMRTGVVLVMSLAGSACVIATVTTMAAINLNPAPGAEVRLLWWFAVGWGLYLLLLYLRFSRGSLDQS